MTRTGPARGVQYFTDDYLEYCKQLTPAQILKFIDQFQRLHLARQQQADVKASDQHEDESEDDLNS